MTFFFAAINIGFIFFIAFRIWKADNSSIRLFFWPALLLKLIAGICLGLIYKFYYTSGDTLLYFQDALKLTNLARSDLRLYLDFLWFGDESFTIWKDLSLLQSRALFMMKITSIINLLSHDNYWITTLYFSFASFLGAWFLVRVIVRFDPGILVPAVIAFLFFPSVVFWSSGLIKESLAMAALFFISMIYLKVLLREMPGVWQWIFLLFAFWILWNLKYYYLAVFLPASASSLAVSFIFSSKLRFQHWTVKFLTGLAIFFIPLVVVSFIHPNFYPERFLDVIVSNNLEFHAISNPEDLIYYTSLEPTLKSVITNAPWALFSGLFRPLPWEAGTVFQFAIAIENTILMLLIISGLTNIRKLIQSPNRIILVAIIVYTITLCVFLALSTPNFGTLSRYRVGFLPFFFLLISIENPLLAWINRFTQRS
jgi:hypothetical protein